MSNESRFEDRLRGTPYAHEMPLYGSTRWSDKEPNIEYFSDALFLPGNKPGLAKEIQDERHVIREAITS